MNSSQNAKNGAKKMSEQQKRDMLRHKNTQNARRNRRRWRENDSEMQQIYDSNERKIEKLERMVVDLSDELKRPNSKHLRTSKSNETKPKNNGSSRFQRTNSFDTERRPEWFGEPF